MAALSKAGLSTRARFKTRCRGFYRGYGGSFLELLQGLLFCLFKACFKVSSGTAEWYRISYGTDFDSSEIAGPVHYTLVCLISITPTWFDILVDYSHTENKLQSFFYEEVCTSCVQGVLSTAHKPWTGCEIGISSGRRVQFLPPGETQPGASGWTTRLPTVTIIVK